MAATKTLAFKVSRRNPELIPPAEPTPCDFKYLSDIDHQMVLRRHYPAINFYKENQSMRGKDPVNIIRDAIAKALVFYYPFAGRLREYSGGRLAVECTGEGVVFVEADADVALEEFGDALYPPFPNIEELFCIQSFDGITNSPLFSFQVLI